MYTEHSLLLYMESYTTFSYCEEKTLIKNILRFKNVYINYAASTVGKKEYEGPLKNYFDAFEEDEYFGCKSYEEAESEMVRRNLNLLIAKANLDYTDIDLLLGGDLINQCTSTSFGIKETNIPYLGLYGACSTAIESILCGSVFINSNQINKCIAQASSHFCAAERQYRFPLEYGSTRTPTSQNTVTGTGAFLLSAVESNVRVESAVIGRIIDKGITDANNMGAAMACAAVDTIKRYFEESDMKPKDFDVIITGDLGIEGYEIAKEMLNLNNIEMCDNYNDCGKIIYDTNEQDMHAGGSGCGCIASVLAGYFIKLLNEGKIKNLLAVGTGALLNPNSVFQKKTIPSIAHAIHLSSEA